MVQIRFERVNQLILISSDSEGRYNNLHLCGEYQLAFTDYIKSQIHLNLVTHVFARDPRPYKFVLQVINGKAQINEETKFLYLEAIQLFYQDMLMFLHNNSKDVSLTLQYDGDRLFTAQTADSESSAELAKLKSLSEIASLEDCIKIIECLRYPGLIDILDISDLKKVNSLATMLECYRNICQIRRCYT